MDNTILIFAIILLALILFFSVLKYKYIQSSSENMGRIGNLIGNIGRVCKNVLFHEDAVNFLNSKTKDYVKSEINHVMKDEDTKTGKMLFTPRKSIIVTSNSVGTTGGNIGFNGKCRVQP
jgi:hypothetical protein